MAQKWNLQDIRPAEPRRKRAPAPNEQTRREYQTAPTREDVPSVVIEDGRVKSRWKLFTAVVVFAVICGGAVALSAFLSNTTLTIYPQNREPNINAEFTAYPDQRENALIYEVMTLDATGERQVSATGQEQVETQARGMIEIVNTTSGAQRLIKNTRFRTDDDRVYRIEESVVVPGAVAGGGAGTDGMVPGTIQAEVFAEAPGDEYNLEAGTRFDIPGFQEGGFDDLYRGIYATNPEPITGGFAGPRFTIPDDELKTARQELQTQLRNELLPQIDTEKPKGYIAFPGSVSFTFSQLPAERYGDDLVTIKEEAVLHIPIFPEARFAEFLASETVATYSGNPVRIENTDVLTFSHLDSSLEATALADLPSLSFSLVGRPLLVWEYDAKKLREDLAGKPKTAINQVLTAYPGIDSARASVKPFWRRSFPSEPEAIEIQEVVGDPGDENMPRMIESSMPEMPASNG